MLFMDAMAGALATVLFFWAIAYFVLVRPKKIKVGAVTVLVHIAAVAAVAGLVSVALPKTLAGFAAAALFSVVSCAMLRSGKAPTA